MPLTAHLPSREEMAEAVYEIVMWGPSQVGKTTWLAGCFGAHAPQWLMMEDDQTALTHARLLSIWNRLISNQLVSGTMAEQHYSVRHRTGPEIRFRDMRGENSQDPAQHQQDMQALRRASAALVFAEWASPDQTKDRIAVNGAVSLANLNPPIPMSLVVTKCENYLDSGSLVRFASDPHRFAEREDFPRHMRDLIHQFRPGHVFPLTVYGYADSGDRPAHFCDEFGRLVPWDIRPFLVDAPMKWAVDAVVAP